MSQADLDTTQDASESENQLEGGTYEIIRNRLNAHAGDLTERLQQLNTRRKDVFGSIDTALLSTERITTANNCVPRDMIAIGDRFIFGYNVRFGLKSEMNLDDVFAIYAFRESSLHELDLALIGDERFAKDFRDVYRYYKNAVFARFSQNGPTLHMVFRVGESEHDIKSFKWVVQGDSLTYVDNRSEHEVTFPAQHEFEWTRTHRDFHRPGVHPHISIEDRVFVETVGGDLTIKIENNTDTGEGIYSEPVEDKDQTLDDAEVHYAIIGNLVAIKIRPYQEPDYRYFIYNDKLQQAIRMDSLQDACVLLPDDHGLIFSNGFYLQTGEYKTFDNQLEEMLFERRIPAANGEDHIHVFYNRLSGVYVLLNYNLISQEVDTPMVCHGYSFFPAGELLCFKSQDQPQKHHAVQLWQTPFVDENHTPDAQSDSLLYKIGNRDLVRGMAECHEVINLISKDDSYANLYVDLVKQTNDLIDTFFWLSNEEAGHLDQVLAQIRDTAASAIGEFEKVIRVKKNTADQTRTTETRARDIIATLHRKRFDQLADFVSSLGDLRTVRGELISLRDLRYVDSALVDTLEQQVAEESDRLATRCVEFLLRPDSLQTYIDSIADQQSAIPNLATAADAKQVGQQIADSASELEMLIDIVSNLNIEDTTQRTTIIDNISSLFANLNASRSTLKQKTMELLSVEGVAEFNSQIKLLNQGVVNYLDISDSPEKCEEYLTKLMIQIEELEGRFAEFDDFIIQLSEKRDEVYSAFENRKVALVEARNKRANTLKNAADRILKGIKTRVDSLESINDINGYFASDLMIDKVRDIVEQLQELEDSVKVDDVQSQLKTIREDAARQLKDRQELYVDGQNVIKFGNHKFNVNIQALDLTTVIRDGEMHLHLTGTNFFEELQDEGLLDMQDVWQQDVPSENEHVYRAEYLAYQFLQDLANDDSDWPASDIIREYDFDQAQSLVARFMGPRYSEGYVKGVHDADAARLLQALLTMQSSIGLLKFSASSRAAARLYWEHVCDKKTRSLIQARCRGFGKVAQAFPQTARAAHYQQQLAELLQDFNDNAQLFDPELVPEAAAYLFLELQKGGDFCISHTAARVVEDFQMHIGSSGHQQDFQASVDALKQASLPKFQLVRDWATAFVGQRPDTDEVEYIDEIALLLMTGSLDQTHVVHAEIAVSIDGMMGSHSVIESGAYQLNYNHFTQRLAEYSRDVAPRFDAFTELKKDILERTRTDMKLTEFTPRVLTSFVRNKLLDEVYLPVIGDNLAKQMGAAGEQKRTDRMGLLLLVSPPGYGKTTLMEYVANRLGVIFMKINGPAIGHAVTSLDPASAPNAGAREEIEKLNLALEMGDNVMLYLDDIQHCNPEFLQKFISLCDAQRKIEGVYKGKTRTYDFRGRKVCVVMAGNPYTESGEKFQIPDMLSNRADIYNLGEMAGEHTDAFNMSYIENCLTSNPVLNTLATRSQRDVYTVLEMARRDQRDVGELEGNYSLDELNEMVNTMQKLMRVRDVILTVNQEYIRSAAQSDDYRTEPPFKLQGSYRNMNRIAEKIVPIMNAEEVEQLILANYENDSQTLTSDTEANMLKFKELTNALTAEEQDRWDTIKRTFQQNAQMRGIAPDDKVGQVVVQLREFGDGLHHIHKAMVGGFDKLSDLPIADAPPPVEAVTASDLDDSESLELVNASVQSLRDSLEGIRQAVSQVAPNLAEMGQAIGEAVSTAQQPQAAAAEPADDASIPTAETTAASSLESSIEAVAEIIHPGKTDQHVAPITVNPDGSQKITVVNKLPRSFLKVLDNQFELMQNWMKPILESSQNQSDQMVALQRSLESLLKKYERLVKKLQSERSNSG